MALVFRVQLESNGLVGEDDGDFVWRSTTVCFGFGTAGIVTDVLVDGYSGAKKVSITRDDFHLPARLVEPMAIALYRICGADMREADCDLGEAIWDVEPLINRMFYHSDADRLLRRFHAVAAAMRRTKKVSA